MTVHAIPADFQAALGNDPATIIAAAVASPLLASNVTAPLALPDLDASNGDVEVEAPIEPDSDSP